MRRRPRIVINTTIIICLAFVFRLLFVNITFFSSINSAQTGILIKPEFSSSHKRISHSGDPAVSTDMNMYCDVEICDEDSDPENLSKANTPAVLSLFYSFFNPFTSFLKSSSSFDLIKCSLYPKRYLALSILRV